MRQNSTRLPVQFEMDLLKIVVKPTWREFLVDLVKHEEMDPWDIDLARVADNYLASVRALQCMDLRVPANVILASALLLRFKAEALRLDWASDDNEDFFEETPELLKENLPELTLKPNRPRKRKVTLDKLVQAMDEVMKRGRRLPRKRLKPAVLEVQLPKASMDEKMASVMEKAHCLKDAEGVLLFSSMIKEAGLDEFALHFLPVMHLVQGQRMLAWQDELFGEIFLRVLPEQSA